MKKLSLLAATIEKWRLVSTELVLQRKSIFLCFVDLAFRYNRVKENQFDAQFILSIFRHPLHVSGVSLPIIWRYKLESDPTRTTNHHLKRIKYQFLYTYGCTS